MSRSRSLTCLCAASRVYLATCRKLGVVPIAAVTRHADSESIRLRNHAVGPRGALALAAALRLATRLQHLDLASTGLGDEGAVAIAMALRDNNSIVTLDLADNGIASSGVSALCELLRNNIVIKELSLAGV